jgi:copper homeostasis protein
MNKGYLLEVSVESVSGAMAAERGGAQRVELCAALAVGGTTPNAQRMRQVRASVQLPVFAMIRPRGGDFVYSQSELAAMRQDIEVAKSAGMNGIVLGILRADGTVDVERTRELVERAKPLPVTFHRAFDVLTDLRKSLEDVISTGAARILTSGGAASAPDAVDLIAELVEAAGERIIILPGSGINPWNIERVVKQTLAREFHSGLSSYISRGSDGDGFELGVRKMAAELARLGA